MKAKADINDVLFVIGLLMLGAGLYLWHGPGVALSVDGAIILVAAVIGTG